MFKKILCCIYGLTLATVSWTQLPKTCDMERVQDKLSFRWNTELIKGGDFEIEVQLGNTIYTGKCPADQGRLEYRLPQPQFTKIKAFHRVSKNKYDLVQIKEPYPVIESVTTAPAVQPMPPAAIIPVWKISMTWSRENGIIYDEIHHLVDDLNQRLQGRLRIEWDETPLARTSQYLQAVKDNQIQLLHTSPNYFKDDIKGSIFFGSVPFGMKHDEVDKWLRAEGLQLWEQLYAPHGLLPFPCGNSGEQRGGWYNREIRNVEDFKGMWIRTAGLAGDILQGLGATIKESKPSEIYAFMSDDRERNRAAQFMGPYDDYQLGLHHVGMYYYDSWNSWNSTWMLLANKEAFSQLDDYGQEIVKLMIDRYNERLYRMALEKNRAYVEILQQKNIRFKTFPTPVMDELRRKTQIAVEDYIHSDPSGACKRIFESYQKFRKQ
jgi:TRAP-type mannitol/chloroaromatic compound transport system substrate-binding protein